MTHLNLDKLAALVALVLLVLIAATFGYRLQISMNGLIFENDTSSKTQKASTFEQNTQSH